MAEIGPVLPARWHVHAMAVELEQLARLAREISAMVATACAGAAARVVSA